MIPPAFEYLRPKTIPEAIGLLQQYGDDAKILSGGQSLIPMMKFRLARPAYLIDINRIAGLSYIKEEGRIPQDRRTDARSRSGEFAADPCQIPHSCRYSSRHRRSASPEHGDAGGQPRPRRSRQRSSGDHAGAAIAKVVATGRARRTGDAHRRFFRLPVHHRTRTRRDRDGDSHSRAPATQWRRLLQAGAEGRRFCHRGGGRASDARRRGSCQSRHRPDQCRRHTRRRRRRPKTFCAARNWTKPTCGRPRNWRRRKRSPARTCADPAEYKKGLVKELTRRALLRARGARRQIELKPGRIVKWRKSK